jgi:hypothetical protein
MLGNRADQDECVDDEIEENGDERERKRVRKSNGERTHAPVPSSKHADALGASYLYGPNKVHALNTAWFKFSIQISR